MIRLTTSMIGKHDGYFEQKIAISNGVPIFLLRAVKSSKGKFQAVVREAPAGTMIKAGHNQHLGPIKALKEAKQLLVDYLKTSK